jgi:NAD(P)-dependent dehydrogenase (short-subunit alcohol dehydrogenase family)
LAKDGACVIVNGRTQGAVDDAVARIRSATGTDGDGFAGDLSLASAAETPVQDHPNVEILVNYLGIFEPKPFGEIPDADWVASSR